MSAQPDFGEIVVPQTLEAAIAAVSDGGIPIAGATWIMRAPLRHEERPTSYVSLGRIDCLHRIDYKPETITVGAMVTHESLIESLPDSSDLVALRTAVGKAANPGVRRLATVGGNLCTSDFFASDISPALLCLDARIELVSASGVEELDVEEFLARRRGGMGACIATHVAISRSNRLSAHERLPMRKAGDYPSAIVSVSAKIGSSIIEDVRIAVGSVEPVARRWRGLEAALRYAPLDPAAAEQAARDLTHIFVPRDATDAPGWYRVSVLPALVRRALTSLREMC